jgi:hypothetical protein
VSGFGDETMGIRFYGEPPRYFDLAVMRQGRSVIYLLTRNRTGPFPVDLRDQLARAMVARAPLSD